MRCFFLYKGLSVGLMIFSMAFGAGNLIYPLATGYHAGGLAFWGFLGFGLASILLPLIAFFSTALYEGDYRALLTNNSYWVIAEIVTFISMLLLGPAGCIPRCVITAHTAINQYLPIHLWIFNGLFLGICYLLARKKSNLIKVLGNVLAPITLGCLGLMILLGIFKSPSIASRAVSLPQAVGIGFYNGCFTFDLLALIFYNRVVFQVVTDLFLTHPKELGSRKDIFKFLLFAGTVAAGLFVAVYGGMTLCAALHSGAINIVGDGQLIAAYSSLLLGNKFGIVYSIVVGLACFSTSFALLVVFADYLVQIFKNKCSYGNALLGSVLCSFVLANLDFKQVSNLMKPMMFLIYPILIPLALFVFLKNIRIFWGGQK